MYVLFDDVRSSELPTGRYVVPNEAAGATRTALAELSSDSREAIWRVWVEGQSAADAGTAMERSARAIHNLCHRARMRLWDHLGPVSRYLSHTG